MRDKRILSNSRIFNEFDSENQKLWFDMKEKKFLHQIDTFYYSVKLNHDFTKNSKDIKYKLFKSDLNKYLGKLESYDSVLNFNIFKDVSYPLNLRNFTYSRYYNVNIECPEYFDIFIATIVPPGPDGQESVTSEIIVQIRSYMLWMYGVHESFHRSYDVVKAICNHYDLEISEVKENRMDYCWHSNYLQNPEEYFRIDNFAKMQISQFRSAQMRYTFKEYDYEQDYIALGKRSDKIFVRIYNKTKEVVEKHYKPWFLKIWLFNGMISRYDFYIYDELLRNFNCNWKKINLARIKFYIEYGNLDRAYLNYLQDIVNETKKLDQETLNNLANSLTPKPTIVTNVEYQVMRRASKSFNLIPFQDNSDKDSAKRIYDYLDNRLLESEYLTRQNFRLCDPNTIGEKDRPLTDFWQRLRSTKIVDVKMSKNKVKLTRDYSRELNKDIIKDRIIHSCVTYTYCYFL